MPERHSSHQLDHFQEQVKERLKTYRSGNYEAHTLAEYIIGMLKAHRLDREEISRNLEDFLGRSDSRDMADWLLKNLDNTSHRYIHREETHHRESYRSSRHYYSSHHHHSNSDNHRHHNNNRHHSARERSRSRSPPRGRSRYRIPPQYPRDYRKRSRERYHDRYYKERHREHSDVDYHGRRYNKDYNERTDYDEYSHDVSYSGRDYTRHRSSAARNDVHYQNDDDYYHNDGEEDGQIMNSDRNAYTDQHTYDEPRNILNIKPLSGPPPRKDYYKNRRRSYKKQQQHGGDASNYGFDKQTNSDKTHIDNTSNDTSRMKSGSKDDVALKIQKMEAELAELKCQSNSTVNHSFQHHSPQINTLPIHRFGNTQQQQHIMSSTVSSLAFPPHTPILNSPVILNNNSPHMMAFTQQQLMMVNRPATVLIHGVNPSITKPVLQAHFSVCGPVTKITFLHHPGTGDRSRLVWVDFTTAFAANNALALDNSILLQETIRVWPKGSKEANAALAKLNEGFNIMPHPGSMPFLPMLGAVPPPNKMKYTRKFDNNARNGNQQRSFKYVRQVDGGKQHPESEDKKVENGVNYDATAMDA